MTWVEVVERAYVAAATGGALPQRAGDPDDRPRAVAALGAIASRYLAVGTPRSIGLILATAGDAPLAQWSLDAHRTWFAPRDVRCATLGGESCGEFGAPVSLASAFASDIVCVHAAIAIRAADLRRGTHVNVLAAASLDDELVRLATICRELPDLGALAAGLVDGRQLDELTAFIAGDAALALAALAGVPRNR